MGLRFRIHVYMFILIRCYIFVVVVGKWEVSGTLPSYEVLSQRNVLRMRLFVLIHIIMNE